MENPSPERTRSIIDFSNGLVEGASIYRLTLTKPKVRDIDIFIRSYVGLFPTGNDTERVFEPGGDPQMFLLIVALLQLPAVINPIYVRQGMRDDNHLESSNLRVVTKSQMPSVTLFTGTTKDTGLNIVSLNAICGISPERALQAVKLAVIDHFTTTDQRTDS